MEGPIVSHHSPLAELGWDNSFAAAFEPFTSGGDHIPARVSRVDRGGADVLGADGRLRASLGREVLASLAIDRTAGPTVGDWVAVRHWPDDRTTLEAILNRRTCVVRDSSDTTSKAQALAANVDLVVVGSRGLAGLRGRVLGSVSRQVVERAQHVVSVVH